MTNMINNNIITSDVIAAATIASTVFTHSSQRKPIPNQWRLLSPDEPGKRVINGKPHTWNNNGSWKLDAIPDPSLTPEDDAAATTIATAQPLIVRHLLIQLPSLPFPLLNRKLLVQLLLLPLLLQKVSSSQLQSRITKVLLVLLQLRLFKTMQTKFTEFKQTYTIMQCQLEECLVT